MQRHGLTNGEWARLEPLLSPSTGRPPSAPAGPVVPSSTTCAATGEPALATASVAATARARRAKYFVYIPPKPSPTPAFISRQ
jgi:hypothetical protein